MSSIRRRLNPTNASLAVTLVCLLSLACSALAPSAATAGRYEVIQCDRSSRGFTDARFDRTNGGDYGFLYRCEEDEDANSLQIRSITGAPQGRYGQISWAAPPEARIVGVAVEARMRSDQGHQARLSFLDADGSETGRIATGSDSATGFESYARQVGDGGRQAFAAGLYCDNRDGCRASDQARNWIRSIDLTIVDAVPPEVATTGSLVAGGWKRGDGTLATTASDAGSGVRSIETRVNGTIAAPSQKLSCALIAGSPKVSRLRPCPPAQTFEADVDTRLAPFVDGANAVRICGSDYGSGAVQGCIERTVMVDNRSPEVAFLEARDREDPELIRASAIDQHSGLQSGAIAYRPLTGGAWRELPTEVEDGELRARVDSASEPRGRYVFRALATDVAGNTAISTVDADGDAMILDFPLLEATRLTTSIGGQHRARVSYGARPKLQAVLRGPNGGPIAGQHVELIERFAPGSSLSPAERTVRTDARGRISAELSRGPSRTIAVSFAGTRRYLPAGTRKVKLAVHGSASLDAFPKHLRAGRRVSFHGSVGIYGAEMRTGKLVELQVKGGGVSRYRTIGRAFRTDSRGAWRMRYRFDSFYDQPTRYRFRLKVSRERNWPYLTPTFSRSRTLIVKPRG